MGERKRVELFFLSVGSFILFFCYYFFTTLRGALLIRSSTICVLEAHSIFCRIPGDSDSRLLFEFVLFLCYGIECLFWFLIGDSFIFLIYNKFIIFYPSS